jgi:hypothetical protein
MCLVKKSIEFHVTAPTFGEVLAIRLTQCSNSRIPVFGAGLSAVITVTIIKTGLFCHLKVPSFLTKRALVERQEIVIPITVGVRTHIWVPPCWPHYADIGRFPCVRVLHKKRVRLVFDAGNDFFSLPHPITSRIA